MTSADRRAFAAELARLAEVFGRPASEALAEAFFDALADCSIEEIRAAVRQLIRSSRFFPCPAELLETVRHRRRELERARSLVAPPQRALADPEALTREAAEIEQARGAFRALVERLAGLWRQPARAARAEGREPTVAEVAEHERRKAGVLAQARAAASETTGGTA